MEKPNIIWFMIDSLRNEFLNEFGAEAERNFLDDLISEGVSFTNCHSVAPFTIVSMGAKLTGCLPSVNGLDSWLAKDPMKAIDANCVTIIDILKYNGYFNTLYTDSPYGIYLPPECFDIYHVQNGFENYPVESYINHKGPKFIYLCTDIIHDACCLSKGEFKKKDYSSYVKKTSEVLKSYYDKIKTNNDLILITSDHGVRCADDFKGTKYNAEKVTGRYLTEKTTHCSFNIIWDNYVKPQKISNLCRSVDIFPTLFDLLGFEYPKLDGESLVPLMKGGKVDIKYAYAITGWSASHPTSIGARCVKDSKFKLVEYEEKRGFGSKWHTELYNYVENPEEDIDLSKQYPDKLVELQNECKKWIIKRRNVSDLYRAFNYNPDKVKKVRKIDSEAIRYVDDITKNVYQKETRYRYLRGYYLSEIKRLFYYYFLHKMLYSYY